MNLKTPPIPMKLTPTAAVLCLMMGATDVVLAQATAPATSAATEPVTMSPFQVTSDEDTGYRATNTLDGSRLNTPLRDTPGAISVFTKDFIDDLAATDLTQLIRYDVNAEESHQDAEFSGVGN